MSSSNEPVLYLAPGAAAAAALGVVVRTLLDATGASRTTVRLCRSDSEVALVAEARVPGAPTMSASRPPGIRQAATYIYLEETHRILVQRDCRTEPPAPPPSLVQDLRVYAQMLAPVIIRGAMAATISVHQQDRPRDWTDADVRALEEAQAGVQSILERMRDFG